MILNFRNKIFQKSVKSCLFFCLLRFRGARRFFYLYTSLISMLIHLYQKPIVKKYRVYKLSKDECVVEGNDQNIYIKPK